MCRAFLHWTIQGAALYNATPCAKHYCIALCTVLRIVKHNGLYLRNNFEKSCVRTQFIKTYIALHWFVQCNAGNFEQCNACNSQHCRLYLTNTWGKSFTRKLFINKCAKHCGAHCSALRCSMQYQVQLIITLRCALHCFALRIAQKCGSYLAQLGLP